MSIAHAIGYEAGAAMGELAACIEQSYLEYYVLEPSIAPAVLMYSCICQLYAYW